MARTSVSRKSTFRVIDLIREALSSVFNRPIRAVLTGMGTILGVGAFVATIALADSTRAQVSSRFDALKATEIHLKDSRPDGSNPFPSTSSDILLKLNGVKHAGLYFPVSGGKNLVPRASLNTDSHVDSTIQLVAAEPGAIAAALPTFTLGGPFSTFHEKRKERVAILGRVAAKQLGMSRVDNQPAVFINDRPFVVVGILDDVRRNPDFLLSVIIPTSTAKATLPIQSAEYQVIIDTLPGAAQLIGRQAPLALRPDAPGRIQALVPPDPTTLRRQVSGDVTSLFLALSILSMLIGAVAIANATLVSVMERRGEIGLRRALGARRLHIWLQFCTESAGIGILSGIIGLAIAVIGVSIACAINNLILTLNPVAILAAPLIGLATGTASGVLPAIRAGRTPPSISLQS